jgi:hypothetical protein
MTKKDIINLTEQVCEAWGHPIPVIDFRHGSEMKNTMAFVLMKDTIIRNIKLNYDFVCFNDYLLFCNTDFILKVIYHEIAHLITRAGDEDPVFEMFCKLNDIPLSGKVCV